MKQPAPSPRPAELDTQKGTAKRLILVTGPADNVESILHVAAALRSRGHETAVPSEVRYRGKAAGRSSWRQSWLFALRTARGVVIVPRHNDGASIGNGTVSDIYAARHARVLVLVVTGKGKLIPLEDAGLVVLDATDLKRRARFELNGSGKS
jgi:hypothetical protein